MKTFEAIFAAPEFSTQIFGPRLVDDDPLLSLLADLAGELDWDDVVGAGLTTSSWSVDRVVLEMSADERRELRRILSEELTKS